MTKESGSGLRQEDLQNFFELPDLLISVGTTEGRFIRSNQAWETILGYTTDDISTMEWIDLVHPEDKERTIEVAVELAAGKTLSAFQNRYRCKNGSYKWLEWTSYPKDGLLYSIARDISEAKDTAEKVVKVEQQLRTVVNNTPFILWAIDTNGNFTLSEGKGLEAIGLNPGEAVGQSQHEITKKFPQVSRYVKRALTGESLFATEYLPHTARWYETYCAPLKDSNGVIEGVVGVSTDITDKTETDSLRLREKKSRESFDQLKRMIIDTPVAMAMFDLEMRYIAFSKTWLSDYNIEGSDLVGKRHYDIFPEIPDEWKVDYERCLAGEILSRAEEKFVRPDGSSSYIRWAIHPWYDANNNIGGMVMVTSRIDELVEAREQALSATKLKSEFLASMSHEIRTPINGVIGMTGMLLETQLDPEQRSYSDAIKSSGETLLTIINDILDFSKIEAGKLVFEDIPFNLRDAVDECRKTLNFTANKKGLDLRIELADNLPVTVSGDPGRLKQIFFNLIGNAIKFTKHGHVIIRGMKRKDRLRFEVEDTGIGIEEAAIKKLFQAFTQVDASTQRHFGGTGLGLTISKKLVELMDGVIGVESRFGEGSTFWFEVVIPECDEEKTFVVEPYVGETRNKNRSIRVLVAEDNHINQIITVSVLQKLGYHADVAANGLEVLSALRSVPYDLILMDCQMPEMDGYEATRHIRTGGRVPNPDIPILAMTANAMVGDSEKCINVGMNGYISKPVNSSKLASTIKAWIPESNLPQNSA